MIYPQESAVLCQNVLSHAPQVRFLNGAIERDTAHTLAEWTSLHGEVPLRVCYGGRGAAAWHAVITDPKYDLGIRERNCLELMIRHFRAFLPSDLDTVVHLGSGDGAEIPIILRHLPSSQRRHYALVDISPNLIDLASNTYRLLDSKNELTPIIADLESPQYSNPLPQTIRSSTPRLILLIANGALLANHRTWHNLVCSLRPIDYVLILLETSDHLSEERIMQSYRNIFVHHLLARGLRQIGLKESAGVFSTIVDAESSQLLITFRPNITSRRKWEASYGTRLNSESLILLRSFKPSSATLKSLAASWGLSVYGCVADSASGCTGLLAQRLNSLNQQVCPFCLPIFPKEEGQV